METSVQSDALSTLSDESDTWAERGDPEHQAAADDAYAAFAAVSGGATTQPSNAAWTDLVNALKDYKDAYISDKVNHTQQSSDDLDSVREQLLDALEAWVDS